MVRVDDQGNIIMDDEEETEEEPVEPVKPELVTESRVIIMKGFQGDEEELENRIEKFLNTEPKKNIISISAWAIGVEHYILIVYRE